MFLLSANGTPICIADDREDAARRFSERFQCQLSAGDMFVVDELAPRDRHPDLVEALEARRLFGIVC
jgi:hypothetical protein